MPIDTVIQQAEHFDIQPFQQSSRTAEQLRRDHVAYIGAPMPHPHRDESLLLATELHGTTPLYYEFRRADVTHIEQRPNVTDIEGRTVPMVRLWVKKGSVGIRYTPFVVADLNQPLR